MRKILSGTVLAIATSATAAMMTGAVAFAADYDIDQGHSSVSFKIRHLVSKTSGKFNKFTGTIHFEPGKPDTWNVVAHIDANTIDTNEPKRDNHLRSPDFFDIKKYPEIVFKSTKVKDANDKSAKLEGDLTIHGVTKPVVLEVEMLGEGTDPWGNKRAGYTATTKLNRKDFGLTWNKALETGGVLVGEDVEINLEIEATAKALQAEKTPVIKTTKAKK